MQETLGWVRPCREPPEAERPGGGEEDEGDRRPAPRQLGDHLDLLAQRVAERLLDEAVGVLQLGAGRRLVGGAARRVGDVLQRRRLHRHGDHVTGLGILDRAVGRTEGDREDGHAGLGGRRPPSSVVRPTVVSPSLSSTIAPGARSSSPSAGSTSESSARSGQQCGAAGQGVADGRRLGELQPVDASVDGLAIQRRRHLDADRTAERDQPDLDVGLDPVDEVAGRLLGRLQPIRLDVGGHHRQRHVEQQQDAAFALRPLDGRRDRPGDGDHAGGQAGQLEDGDDVAPPPRSGRRHPVEQLDLGEADRCPAPPAQHDDVADGQRDDHEQPPQPAAVEEGRGDHRLSTWAFTACTRRRRTWLTRAPSQSPSVVSSMRSAPDRRMPQLRCSTSSAAAAA